MVARLSFDERCVISAMVGVGAFGRLPSLKPSRPVPECGMPLAVESVML